MAGLQQCSRQTFAGSSDNFVFEDFFESNMIGFFGLRKKKKLFYDVLIFDFLYSYFAKSQIQKPAATLVALAGQHLFYEV